jgi:hypothetical protein
MDISMHLQLKQNIFEKLEKLYHNHNPGIYYTNSAEKLEILYDSHINIINHQYGSSPISIKHHITFGNGKLWSISTYPLKLFLHVHYWTTQIKQLFLLQILNTPLKELDLSASMLGVDCYKSAEELYTPIPKPPSGIDLILLTNILNQDNGLEVLNLSYNFVMFMDMPQEILVKFFAALETNRSIKKLIISFTYLTDFALQYLAKAIENNTCIEILVLKNNSLCKSKELIDSENISDAYHYKNLIDMTKRFSAFKGDSTHKVQSFNQLIKGIGNNTSLKDVSLIGYNFTSAIGPNEIGPNEIGFRGLLKHASKKKLNLSDTIFSIENAIHLAKGIAGCASIESICMNRTVVKQNNRLHDGPIKMIDIISVPLMENNNLKQLHLTNIIAIPSVVNTFIDILEHRKNITHLDISYNNIMNKQVERFSVIMDQYVNMESFRANNTFVLLESPLEQIMKLLKIIENNSRLMYFGLTIRVSETYMTEEFNITDKNKIIRRINAMLQSQLNLDYLDLQIYCSGYNNRWVLSKDTNNREVKNIIESIQTRRELSMIPVSVRILDLVISPNTVGNWTDGYAGHIKRKTHRLMQGELMLFLHHTGFCNITEKISNIKISIIKNILEYLYKLRPTINI